MKLQKLKMPHTAKDFLAMGVFFFGGIFLLWYELIHVSTHNFPQWTLLYTCHLLIAIYFAINIYGNWFMAFLTASSGHNIIFPSGPTPPGWRYCDRCIANRPPRSYHCPVCEECILKRDHHCWLVGRCIGYSNHRYFFALAVHMFLAGVYCNIYNWNFVWSVRGKVTFLNILSFIFPHFTTLIGNETLYTCFISTVSMIGFVLTFLCSWLLQVQMTLLKSGQTQFEKKKGITEYNQNLWTNVDDILGHRKFLVLFWPWLRSNLPGDGLTFHSQSQKEI